MNKFYIYQIIHKKHVLYIGQTDNLNRREKQHNYHLKKGTHKELYNYLREIGITQIKLKVIKEVNSRTEAKRIEIFLILTAHFKNRKLFQKIPSIGH